MQWGVRKAGSRKQEARSEKQEAGGKKREAGSRKQGAGSNGYEDIDMKEYVIYPLVIGANQTDQGIMTYLRGYGKRLWIPIYAFLIKGADEVILVDTGLEQFVVPEHVGRENGLKIQEFEEALEDHGLRSENIDLIIHTHLHNDHCENDPKCPQAKIIVQKAEYDFFLNPHPIDHRYYPDLLDGLNVELVEGDVSLMDGIDLIFTPGHTPGGQSVAVHTSGGRAIITGFCCNALNFPANAPIVAPGVHTDAIAAFDSAMKIREMADILIPLHDISIGKVGRIPGI
ncbi:MAG: N-acyl homoserine lactonase family protein [Syntrophobacteraceae bacterium]